MKDTFILPRVSRRGFLKAAGAAIAAPIIPPNLPSGPLFIPAERLEMGVPSTKYIRPDTPITSSSVMMTLLRNEFILNIPPHKFPAGSKIPVPPYLAERWEKNNIAVRTNAHPNYTPPPDVFKERLAPVRPVSREPILSTKPTANCVFGKSPEHGIADLKEEFWERDNPGRIYGTDIDPLPVPASNLTWLRDSNNAPFFPAAYHEGTARIYTPADPEYREALDANERIARRNAQGEARPTSFVYPTPTRP